MSLINKLILELHNQNDLLIRTKYKIKQIEQEIDERIIQLDLIIEMVEELGQEIDDQKENNR